MTKKNRCKECYTCGMLFSEKYRESNKEWESREYCSMLCNNRSDRRIASIFERLSKNQVVGAGCWGWAGSIDGAGYGTISNRKGRGFSPEKAHRVSYEKTYGTIPKGINICHKCDNPPCTNPEHLFAGTQKENMQDCSRKGRVSKLSIANLRPNPSLTVKQVHEIRLIKYCARNGRGEGRTVTDVAKEYGVSKSIVTAIKNLRYKRKNYVY